MPGALFVRSGVAVGRLHMRRSPGAASGVPRMRRAFMPHGGSCFTRIQNRLVAMGQWEPIDAILLGVLAGQCSVYIKLASELRTLKKVTPGELKKIESSV